MTGGGEIDIGRAIRGGAPERDGEVLRREDADTAELVSRIQAGEDHLFTELYERYFDRVYGYLRIVLRDHHEAEDAAQQVFIKVLEALPRYERRSQPFRAWLFVIARNHAMRQLSKGGRVELMDPDEVGRRRSGESHTPPALNSLGWLTDKDLLVLVERLPPWQRQVLVLRFMLDLSVKDTAKILGKSADDVRSLQYRALEFLRERLASLGRAPQRRGGARMRTWQKPAQVIRHRRFALLGH